jgi:hypothetical protein
MRPIAGALAGHSCNRISRFASRKLPSISTAKATIAASTHNLLGPVRAVCHTKAPNAAAML